MSSSSAASRKRSSSSSKPAGKKSTQQAAEPAAVGGLALSSVEAVLGVFDQHPYMISASYVAELRAMSAAWNRVAERCDIFQRQQGLARAEAEARFDGPQYGVICEGHFYLGGSDSMGGTPLGLELWAMVLEHLPGVDRLAFSRASKTCLSLHRSLVSALRLGPAAPTGAKALAAVRSRTRERCGSNACQELEETLSMPRCREIVVGRPVSNDIMPGHLPDWYYTSVVLKALLRCTNKTALRLTHAQGDSQLRFVQSLYYSASPEPLTAMGQVSCIVVQNRTDLVNVLKAMSEGLDGYQGLCASGFPPILFEAQNELITYGPGTNWTERGLSKRNWAFSAPITDRMRAFNGIFVRSAEAFEKYFAPASSGTADCASGSSKGGELSPLFTVVFPVYIDANLSAAVDPTKWSRAKRYQPNYFKEGEAEGLLDYMCRKHKRLSF